MTARSAPSWPLRSRALVGMVHVYALPGTPFHQHDLPAIEAAARRDAALLADAGFDAILVENMHDRPYVHGRKGPETVAAMTRLALAVADECRQRGWVIPLGVQVLSGGNHEALAIALVAGAAFIRCENFVFAHVADEGLLATAEAGDLLRYRRAIDAQHVGVWCDIKKKHASHAITADVSIAEAAHGAEFFGASALIVTGVATGKPTDPADVRAVREASTLPIAVGSGVTPSTLGPLFDAGADALIVGSSIKVGGVWTGAVDPARAAEIVRARG